MQTKYYKYLYFLLLIIIGSIFLQNDLVITSLSSIEILRGHFYDFYDYNFNNHKYLNDYFPIVYYVFSIWNFPLEMLGYYNNYNNDNGLINLAFVWNKLLLATLFFLSLSNLSKIQKILNKEYISTSNISLNLYFATSPIAIFCVFIFGQYDILGITFLLIGLKFLLSNKVYKSGVFFGLAVSVKYFPLIAVIIFIFFLSKSYKAIFKICFMVFIVVFFQIYLYANSQVFLNRMLAHVYSKFGNLTDLYLDNYLIITTLLSIILIGLLFIRHYILKKDLFFRFKISACFCLLIYGTVFSFVLWHPQWIIYIVLFQTFCTLYLYDTYSLTLVDMFGFLSYTAICAILFHGNVDQSMVQNGLFNWFFPETVLELRYIYGNNSIDFYRSIFISYMFYPLLCILYLRIKELKSQRALT